MVRNAPAYFTWHVRADIVYGGHAFLQNSKAKRQAYQKFLCLLYTCVGMCLFALLRSRCTAVSIDLCSGFRCTFSVVPCQDRKAWAAYSSGCASTSFGCWLLFDCSSSSVGTNKARVRQSCFRPQQGTVCALLLRRYVCTGTAQKALPSSRLVLMLCHGLITLAVDEPTTAWTIHD